MKKHSHRVLQNEKLRIAVCILVCFLIGCLIAAGLFLYDRHQDNIRPLTEGQLIDLSAFGFSMTVPEDWTVLDCTEGNQESGDNALFAGIAGNGSSGFRFYVYPNDKGDRIEDYPESEIVSYYVRSGAGEVRLQSFGDHRFVCYAADIAAESGTERWFVCESWDPDRHLVFETDMPRSEFLPIAASVYFTEPE